MEMLELTSTMLDVMPTKFKFRIRYTVVIPDRTIESKLLWESITALRQLETSKITLKWVPAYEG